jgi:GT2 family glycosyltransferase
VSVVVSTYTIDRLNDVLECISSLKRQTLRPLEIILVLDNDVGLVDFYRSRVSGDVKIVVSDGFGLSNARNAGVKNAEGEIVAFIDDDAVADERWLENLVKSYDDPLVLGVGGLIKPIWESSRPIWFPEELDWIVGCSYKGLPERKTCVRNPIGCNMSFRRSVIIDVGYFSMAVGRIGNNLLGHEDTEFGIRATNKLHGTKIIFDPEAVVYHKVSEKRATLKYVLRRSFAEGFSKSGLSSNRSNTEDLLSPEKRYLTDLFLKSIPSRLSTDSKPEDIYQIITLSASVILVVTGYLFGKHG